MQALMNSVMRGWKVQFKNFTCYIMITSFMSVEKNDFWCRVVSQREHVYAMFNGVLLFHKRLEQHLENYPGLEIFHMSKQFKKNSNVVSDGN